MNAVQHKHHDDFIQPFLIHQSHIRGRFVRLGPVVDTILSRHDYPPLVSKLLGEALLLISILSANLKSEGILTVQAKGDGPVRLLVVDMMENGTLRGYAEMREGAEDDIRKMKETQGHPPLKDLMGKGYLAITIDPGVEEGERYQGIVDLNAATLTDALCAYFSQSQQVDVTMRVAVGRNAEPGRGEHWCAGGIIIERMPEHGGHRIAPDGEDASEQWNRERILMESVMDHELLDPHLSARDLLYRLFNEDGVWVYDPETVKVGCRCSREKIEDVLSTIAKEELAEMVVDGKISVNCHFCNKEEVFTEQELLG